MLRTWLLAVAALSLLVACSSTSGPSREVVGTISGVTQDDPVIGVVVTGRVIDITVVTYAGMCSGIGRMAVEVGPSEVDVTPFDREPEPGALCDMGLQLLQHTASVTVVAAGQYRIVVHGLDVDGNEITTTREIDVSSAQ